VIGGDLVTGGDVVGTVFEKGVFKNHYIIEQAKFVKEYCAKVEVELGKTCNAILSVFDGNLISKSTIGESTAFYRKMKEDYYRYIAKFSKMTPKTKVASSAKSVYEESQGVGCKHHPQRGRGVVKRRRV
jgi:hypothetical protein